MHKIITSIACLLFCFGISLNAQTTTFTITGGNFSCSADEFCVTVDVTNFDSILNLQWAMEWDSSIIAIDRWSSTLPAPVFFNESQTQNGRLGFLWGGSSLDLPDGTSIIEMCFTPVNGGTSMIDFIPPLIDGSLIEVSGFRNGMLVQNVPSEFNAATVNILDLNAPSLTCPNDTMIISNGTVVNNIAPIAMDDCSDFSVSYTLEAGGAMIGSGTDDASGTFFNPGTTTVTYTATDNANNTVSCSFDVILETDNTTDGILEYIPTINFDCNNNTAVMCLIVNNFDSITSHQMGIFWDTSALEFVSANRDLAGTGTFNPNVLPNAGFYTWAHPTQPGGPISTTLPDGSKILTVNFNIVGDLVSPLVFIDDFSPVAPVAIANEDGLMEEGTQFVFLPNVINIIDDEGPMLGGACANVSAEVDPGQCSARVVIPLPTATDECSGVDALSYTIDGTTTMVSIGDTDFLEVFPTGTTSVTITATDGNNNSTSCTFDVIITDNELPSVACPENVEIDAAAGQTSVVVNNIAPLGFTENCPGSEITYTTDNGDAGDDDASGLSFPIGVTTVTYLVTDASGNETNCSFTVTINQLNAPERLEFTPTITIDCETNMVTYCLSVNNFTDIQRMQMGIRYDNTSLQFVSATKDVPGAGGDPSPNLSPDHIWYAWSRPGPISLTNGTKILTINFQLIGEINLPLTNIEDIGPGLQIMVDDANGPLMQGDDFVFFPEMETISTDTNGPMFLSGCLELVVPTDPDQCSANVEVPAPTAQDFCSGVDSITYTFNGVTTRFLPGQTSFNGNFPLGTTTVRFNAFDGNGNMSTCGLDVIVQDMQPPTISCPETDVYPNDPGQCSAFVDLDLEPTAMDDNCGVDNISYQIAIGGNITAGTGLVQPMTFPVGTSTITYTIEDAAGNATTCQIIVEVGDVEAPGITCPDDIVTTIPPGDTDVTLQLDLPTGMDNCNDNLTYTYEIDGVEFPVDEPVDISFSVGETIVTGTVSDGEASAQCTFTVTVNQSSPDDLIECPQNKFSCTAVVTDIDPIYLADEDDVTVTYTLLNNGMTINGNGSASGATFQTGMTTVTYNATGLGTTDECSFVVTVDDIAPVFDDCPMDIIAYADPGDCGNRVNWTVPAVSDNCGIASVIASNMPEEFFGVGNHTVNYAALDSVGNQTICSFTIEMRDTISPTVNGCPPGDLEITQLTGSCGAIGTWTPPSVVDNCPNPATTSSHSPGDTFFVTTTVTYSFTDFSGNESFCSFIIEVDNADTDPPVIMNCPVDTVIFADQNMCGTVYTWEIPTITDACSDAFIDSPIFAPGDTFPLGVTTVGYQGFDSQGNQATCSFTITVRDTFPPTLTCPATVLAFATDVADCGVIVNSFDLPVGADNCDEAVMVICTHNPGDFFNVGTTTVVCTAIDDSDNRDSCIFNVIVEDQFVPTITCPEDIVVNIDGTIESGTPGIVNSIVANNSCDSVILTFNTPMGMDNCPIGMPVQVSGAASGTTVAIGEINELAFVLDDGANTSDTCRFSILVNPGSEGVSIIEDGDGMYCSGETLTLRVDSIPGATYEWTLPLGNTVSGSTLIVTGLTPSVHIGTYQVACRLGDNCVLTDDFTIDAMGISPTFDAGTDNAACNQPVQFFFNLAPDSSPVDSVRWNGPGGYTSTDQEPLLNAPVAGTYTVTAFNGTCSSSQSITINSVNVPNVNVFSDCSSEVICAGDICNLIGTTVSNPDIAYNWAVSDGCTIILDSDDNLASITSIEPGSCEILYWLTLDGCSSDTARTLINTVGEPEANDDFVAINEETTEIAFNVLSNDIITMGTIPTVEALTQPNNGTLTYDGDGVFSFAVGDNFPDLNQFQYELCYECNGEDLCNTAIVTIQLQDTSCVVPSIITPNDDGFNDELIISCLRGEDFPDAEMTIYNQWGDEVYKRKPYGNGVWWDGTYNGDPVTDGTFYYIFTKSNNDTATRGYITVYR